MDVFFPWNLLFLWLCFEPFEPWLVCHCCFVLKLDMHDVDVYQKGSIILFLEYQKGCSSLARIPIALFNFCFKVFVWSLKSKCSSNKTPRYLVQVSCLIFWPLKREFIFLVICFLGDRKITISVLLTFKAILFARSHWTRFNKSKVFFYWCLWEKYW